MTDTRKYINLLIQMLAIPSISKQEKTRADFLESWIKNEGLTVQRIKNNLLISCGNNPAKARFLLNSHLDTVPAGDGWTTDPNLPVRKNGKIKGLGSNDAGACVISLLAAFQSMVTSENADSMVLLISAEEEISGKNGISMVLPKLPHIEFALVGEPTDMQPAIAERGLMVIDAVAKGMQGHAAREEGVNAIYLAVEDILKIQDLHFENRSPWLADPSVSVTMMSAGSKHNIVPGICNFVIDVRSNDKYSNVQLLDLLKQECKSELVPRSMRLRSSSLPENHFFLNLVKDLKLTPFGSPTLSDMALMGFSSVKIGPGNSARSHTANEYILEDEIQEAIKIYEEIIPKILKELV